MEPPLDGAAWAAVVLAAGEGRRMRSSMPKVLHPVAGRPMVAHVVAAVRATGVARTVVVVGHHAAAIQQALGLGLELVPQDPPLGTGDALARALEALGEATHILVNNGDMPLVRAPTLRRAMQVHLESQAAITILTCLRADPGELGRVLRSPDGSVRAVVEARDATPADRNSHETNEGTYCINTAWVRSQLARLPRHENGEYYLTDLVGVAAGQGRLVSTVRVDDPDETRGVNDRGELSRVEAAMRGRIRDLLMHAGVTIVDPPTTFVDATVCVGQDTVIHPFTTITGDTVIAGGCEIGPHAIISDSRIGEACRVLASTLEGAVLEDRVDVGPYSHLRPGAYVEHDVHLGNYVEIKASRIGAASAIGHFSYIGDAVLGERVNIGAGTITCNFDGVHKNPTTIGSDVFIGSDTMLVAPVTIHDRAATGAGAVVTKNVAEETLVVGIPARPVPGKRGPRNHGP